MRTPRSNAQVRLGGGGVGVPGRDGDAARDELVDQLERRRAARARASTWRTGPASSRRRSSARSGSRRLAAVVDAEARRRQERALEVRAEHARADAVGRHRAQRGEDLVLGRGDERRLERGRAGRQHRLAGARVAVAVGVDEVDAGEAVDLEVDEARRGDAVAVAERRAPRRSTMPSWTSTSPGTRRPPTSAASTPSLTGAPPAAPRPWPPTPPPGRRARASLMCPHASKPHTHRSSTPSSRAIRTAVAMSAASAAGTPKPWIQICGTRSCSRRELGDAARVLAHERLERLAEAPSSTGRWPSVCRPGSAASRDQSEIPCGPSVCGSGQIAGLAPWRGDVGDEVADEVDHRVLAEREHLGRQLGRHVLAEALAEAARGRPRSGSPSGSGPGRSAAGGSSAARRRRRTSAPVSIAASIHSRTNSRTRGWFGQPAGTRRPVSSTWPSSVLAGTKRLSASPPNMWQTPHGPTCTSRPASCERRTISFSVVR